MNNDVASNTGKQRGALSAGHRASAALHRQGQDFAAAHEAFLTDEPPSGYADNRDLVQGPVEMARSSCFHGKPCGNAVAWSGT